MPPPARTKSSNDTAKDRETVESPRVSVSSLSDVAALISNASSIVVLTGAGISVSCGIPDFRSTGGLYETIQQNYGLPNPEIIFDVHEFHDDPSVFYSFAKHLMPPPSLKPSLTHRFIANLSKHSKLLRVYSQNIDGLESRAGVSENRLVLCHGSFLSASCTQSVCDAVVSGDQIVDDVLSERVPQCEKCKQREQERQNKQRKRQRSKKRPRPHYSFYDNDDDDEDEDARIGVMKPDIVFFGEKLPTRVSASCNRDVRKADLLLVIGTSLTVQPIASFPKHFPKSVPRILINQQLVKHDFDVELVGDCDIVIRHIMDSLGWKDDIAENHVDSDTGSTQKNRDNGERVHDNVKFIPPRQFQFKSPTEENISA